MNSLYADAKIIKDHFSFLEDLGFHLTRQESLNYGSYVEYKGHGIKIKLGFDFKDYFFYFDIYKSEDLEYSDAAVYKDIIPFDSLMNNYDRNALQPNKKDGYEPALKNNVNLLKYYFSEINVLK